MPSESEKRFIEAWRYAAPRLKQIRERELRELDDRAGLRGIAFKRSPALSSGLIEFQSWMMRWRVIQLQQSLLNRHGDK